MTLGAGPVAQWLEQGTHNPLVVGSSPTGPTIVLNSNSYFFSANMVKKSQIYVYACLTVTEQSLLSPFLLIKSTLYHETDLPSFKNQKS